ncbi:hypothetical protein [Saccharothrix texasensis]|uniref:Peptidase inhibitor family I36 n=1 Tax=Saccharothrix texasensis TaxID=103734 RepID=A0A3N1HD10_9PSEU|nr:hypothetical protein [Saccharothrix texasensis]ROP40393.1 hypothetical protein EDD40_5801 [Saccharothrix texasensis]
MIGTSAPRRRFTVLAALLFAAAAATPAAAAASASDVSGHCRESGYCVFSGASFTGARTVVPQSYGCHPVTDLGFPTARSAARGFGDGTALQLFADTACTALAATVYHEVPATTAGSYRLMPIPA